MIESAYIDDLQIHGGTDYGISGFQMGSPAPRAVTDLRPSDHGATDDTRYYGPRTFDVVGRILAATTADLWGLADALKGALVLGSWHVLKFRREGLDYDERCLVRVDSPVDMPLVLGSTKMLQYGVTLFAADPRLYADTESAGAYDPTTSGEGGLSFPLEFPLIFAVGAGTVLDEFTYPDGDLIGNGDWVETIWGSTGTRIPQVSSGTVVKNTLAGGADLSTDRSAGRATWTFADPPSGANEIEFYAISDDTQTMITAYCRDTDGIKLGKYVAGGALTTLAGPFAVTWAAGDVVTLEWDDTNATVSHNGTELGSAAHGLGTDTGRLGFWNADASASIESVLYSPAGSDAAALSVENEGTIATPPAYVITGPVTNPIIDNDTTGESIYTQGLALSAGETIEIDVATRTVLLGGTTERPDLIDVSLTTWGYLAPGTNLLRLRGDDMSAGSTELAVTFRSARI